MSKGELRLRDLGCLGWKVVNDRLEDSTGKVLAHAIGPYLRGYLDGYMDSQDGTPGKRGHHKRPKQP